MTLFFGTLGFLLLYAMWSPKKVGRWVGEIIKGVREELNADT